VINVGQMIGQWSESGFVPAVMIVGGIVLMVVSVLMLVTGSLFTIWYRSRFAASAVR
jgi:hypothetical protein